MLTGELPRAVRSLELDACRLARVRLPGGEYPLARLVDCELAGCDLAGVRAARAHVRRVAVLEGRLTGADLTDGAFADVLVRGCRADLAAFGRSRLERVRFEGCDLREADLAELQADAVAFVDCDLSGATLTGSRFKRSELRGCVLDGVVGIEALRGVTLPLADAMAAAPALAAALGIRLVD